MTPFHGDIGVGHGPHVPRRLARWAPVHIWLHATAHRRCRCSRRTARAPPWPRLVHRRGSSRQRQLLAQEGAREQPALHRALRVLWTPIPVRVTDGRAHHHGVDTPKGPIQSWWRVDVEVSERFEAGVLSEERRLRDIEASPLRATGTTSQRNSSGKVGQDRHPSSADEVLTGKGVNRTGPSGHRRTVCR